MDLPQVERLIDTMTLEENSELEDRPQGARRRRWIVLSVFAVLLAGYIGLVLVSFEKPENPFAEEIALQEREADPSGEDDHESLRIVYEIPAKKLPVMLPVSELPDNDYAARQVIGVTNGELAHAYVIKPIPLKRYVLLISTIIGDRPLVISHNYKKDSTRVFSGQKGQPPLDIQIGGVDWKTNLVFLYDGVRYVESSPKIPLEPYRFERTSLDQWLAKHPDSLVNFDEELSDENYFDVSLHTVDD